ncbi:nuclear transport factor 2 family protein [Dokdonella sp.]|uniref:nuclear transport factor 2 family protein n=1 Tax=Dokdonella sp. TaxID=2291710 RepID=UPI0031BD6C6B|nr:nuclear transport factor 2 family protein [Dokdonella sp.]
MWKWAGILLGIGLLAACARAPDAQVIRTSIQAMAAAAEARDANGVLDHISADFTGNDGAHDRDGLGRLMRAQWLAGRGIGAQPGAIEVELDGDRATARFALRLDDASGRWLMERSARFDVVTGWRREGGTWRCHYANWTRAGR